MYVIERKIVQENNQRWLQEFYRNGNLRKGFEGRLREWHESGQLWAESFFINGKREGERLEYDRKGNLVKQTFWKEGVEVSKEEFYEKGLSLALSWLKS